LFLFCAAT
jgi:hypothetical protein